MMQSDFLQKALGEPNLNLNANFDFQSSGRETDSGYEVEFIIPFLRFPFQTV